jgi:hypothetical protein
MSVSGRGCVRRLSGVLMLALAAGIAIPGASAFARPSKGTPSSPGAAPHYLRFGVRLVDTPLAEADDPRAQQAIIDVLPTGSAIGPRILIVNEEPTAGVFAVFPGAAQISNGDFIGAADGIGNELTGWITVQHPTVRLGPGQSAMDQVTIRVPKGATKGEHYGVIWTEQVAPARDSRGVAVRMTARVGVRVYLGVGRGGLPPTQFDIMSITGMRPAPSRPLLIVAVNNVGGRAVDLEGTLRLTNGPGRSTAGAFNPQQMVTLAPGQSGNVVFALPATLPTGPWTANVTLQSGLYVATAQATVLFKPPVPGSRTNAAALAGAAAVLALIAIATFLAIRSRRPRRALA